MSTDHHDPFEPGNWFRVGGAEKECIDIRVLSRASAEDYWDGNWLRCEISIAAGGFEGRFEANLRTDELERFRVELQALYATLRGTARYESMEEQLRLVLEGDGRGHITCAGEARDDAGTGNRLTFHLELDQTQVFGTIAKLGELLNRFPVRGSPDA